MGNSSILARGLFSKLLEKALPKSRFYGVIGLLISFILKVVLMQCQIDNNSALGKHITGFKLGPYSILPPVKLGRSDSQIGRSYSVK